MRRFLPATALSGVLAVTAALGTAPSSNATSSSPQALDAAVGTPALGASTVAAARRRTRPTVSRLSTASGSTAGGQLVTIYGARLRPAKAVTFGPFPAVVVAQARNGKSVQVRTPAVTTSQDVSVLVKTSKGWSKPSTGGRFTFVATPTSAPAAPAPAPAPEPTTGSVTGRVTADDASAGLGEISVVVSPSDQSRDPVQTVTATDGSYTIGDLPPGSYSACFYSAGTTSLLDQCYANKPADGSVGLTDVLVLAGRVTDGVDASMASGGFISGTVLNAESESAVPGINVEAYGTASTGALTDGSGAYTLGPLTPGSYKICFSPNGGDASAYESRCFGATIPASDPVTGSDVVVTAGHTTDEIDANLRALGSITGHVTSDADNSASAGVSVEATSADGSITAYGVTDVDGSYAVQGLPSGQYSVCFHPDDASHAVARCYTGPDESAFPVSVTDGHVTAAIDVALGQSGGIAGSVTRATDHTPVPNAQVSIFPTTGDGAVVTATTAADGGYFSGDLPAGSYTVCFYPSGTALLAQCFDNQPGDGSGDDEAVPVTNGAVTPAINAALAPAGAIKGTLTDQAGQAVVGANVEAVDDDGNVFYATTNAAGVYQVTGLPANNYTVCFRPLADTSASLGLTDWCYNDRTGGADGPPTALEVSAGSVVSSIDGVLMAGGRVTGTVRDADSAAALADVEIDIFGTGSDRTQMTTSSALDGTYSFNGLSTRQYYVCFYPDSGHAPRCYDDRVVDGAVVPTEVSVASGTTTDHIDADLPTS